MLSSLIRYQVVFKILIRVLVAFFVGLVLILMIWQGLRFTGLDLRLNHLVQAAKWSIVSANWDDMPHEKTYGFIERAFEDGSIEVVLYTQAGLRSSIKVLGSIDPLVPRYMHDYERYLLQYRRQDAVIDIYDNQYIVIWVDGEPINLQLIEQGLAIPNTVPSALYPRIWVRHHWRSFRYGAEE